MLPAVDPWQAGQVERAIRFPRFCQHDRVIPPTASIHARETLFEFICARRTYGKRSLDVLDLRLGGSAVLRVLAEKDELILPDFRGTATKGVIAVPHNQLICRARKLREVHRVPPLCDQRVSRRATHGEANIVNSRACSSTSYPGAGGRTEVSPMYPDC